jgi:cell wall-associated NlpC family hydrolase
MKKITSFSIIVFLMLFMSACSQVQRRPAHQPQQQSANTRPHAQVQPSQQHSQVSQIPQQAPGISNNPSRNLMVNVAKSAIGTPYHWGGDNPRRGFDCSGLMTYVHKNALGLKIPRTAAQQRDKSRTISYAQLQPGDMLFFKTGRKSNHVGIYVGNRKFVHAPSGGKRVKVSSMDSSYWYKHFVKFGTFL